MSRGILGDIVLTESEEVNCRTAEQDTAVSEVDSLGIPDFLDEELFAWSEFSM
ncbi:hypothetical protein FRC20_012107 [Serendipita sp. 405]|nr:hypothetical protein FRC15_011573 [Serendipita sp. 397]KAG8858039.1 hypothetical protein FRC20_012107 [Serendipita sp. 405]